MSDPSPTPAPGGSLHPVPLAQAPLAQAPLRGAALADIAAGLARTAHLWQSRQGLEHPTERTGLRLIDTREYDVWLLRWPPGTRVSPHDHGASAGAFAVAAGELREVRWFGPVRRERVVGSGETVVIEPGVIHDVSADTAVAWSVHVYSPPLTSMGFYDEDDGLRPVGRQPVDHGELGLDADRLASVGATRLHPAGTSAGTESRVAGPEPAVWTASAASARATPAAARAASHPSIVGTPPAAGRATAVRRVPSGPPGPRRTGRGYDQRWPRVG